MEFARSAGQLVVGLPLLLLLAACQRNDAPDEHLAQTATTDSAETASSVDGSLVVATTSSEHAPVTLDSALSAVMGASEIPYPVYPNGTKYRVGGENGLKIVVFQTDDAFRDVDRYYREAIGDAGMARLIAMNDYVRYSRDRSDDDPWATHRPGIVIHQFNGQDERDAVGASKSARTNIIMSF